MAKKFSIAKTYSTGNKFRFGNADYVVTANEKGRKVSLTGLKPKESKYIIKAAK